MKRKSGLHKKVSSIFGDIPVPENPVFPDLDPDESASRMNIPGLEPPSSPSAYQRKSPDPQSMPKRSRSNQTAVFDEDDEFAADQRKKLFMVIALAIVLVVVLFVQFYKPKKASKASKAPASVETAAITAAGFDSYKIDWSSPEPWTDNVRDPMVYKENEARLFAVESKVQGPLSLRGIVHKPTGGSMALIGVDILYVGDQVDGWTVKEIQPEVVKLENTSGEELVLKMQDR